MNAELAWLRCVELECRGLGVIDTVEQLAAFLEGILQYEVIYAFQTKEQGIKKKKWKMSSKVPKV